MIIVRAYYDKDGESVKDLEDAVLVEIDDLDEGQAGQYPVSDLPYLMPIIDDDGYEVSSLKVLGYGKKSN